MQLYQRLTYLEGQLSESIKSMRNRSNRNRSRSLAVNLSSAILGVLVTIALGLQIPSLTIDLKNFALVCGALISVVNAIGHAIGYRSQWINEKVTMGQFILLQSEIAFYKAGLEKTDQVDEQRVEEFFEKYKAIWGKDSNELLRLRRDQDDGGKGS